MIYEAVVCRACGHSPLEIVLSLGQTPLANNLLTARQLAGPEPVYPLEVGYCPACALVQITETVPPEKLFREYLYFSSFSDVLLRHAEEIATRLIDQRHLWSDSLVVEVASNDGYLLQYYKRAGIPVLGIEPALNVARVAEWERGIPTLTDFFGAALAEELRVQGRRADVIHANNVLAHVADLNGFVEGLRLLLKDEGVAVIEVPYVKDLIDHCEFDTIYHEHLCYFSLTALDRLFRRHGLLIGDVERTSIHGGSLRLFASQASKGCASSDAVRMLLARERLWGVDQLDYFQHFGERVERLKRDLRALLHRLRQDGSRIAAYGAAAKGSTLLNYFGIGWETLDFVVDRSTHKQGLYMPGVHLPIYAPSRVLEEMPDYLLILAWNFAAEIISQQTEYQERGGMFIVPVPEPQVVKAAIAGPRAAAC
ncbi:MAG: class I SAM-dependent methyltransferase [Chloroflexota bacterium]|nr:MAG: class I SAM-dependent methyltransferase [Chloroflexota bacterium]